MSEQNNTSIYFSGSEYFQKIEKTLASHLKLEGLNSGIQIIRDTNGWRENEKSVQYSWIIIISRSFIGWGGLFQIKFNENKFREHLNPEEFIQGLFIHNEKGEIQIYTEQTLIDTFNPTQNFRFNLFEANPGIALDGTTYDIKINAPNINSFIQLNNPNTSEWKKWEAEIWTMGKSLAEKSKNQQMMNLFK